MVLSCVLATPPPGGPNNKWMDIITSFIQGGGSQADCAYWCSQDNVNVGISLRPNSCCNSWKTIVQRLGWHDVMEQFKAAEDRFCFLLASGSGCFLSCMHSLFCFIYYFIFINLFIHLFRFYFIVFSILYLKHIYSPFISSRIITREGQSNKSFLIFMLSEGRSLNKD